jgi:hypothetical protein
MLPLLAWILAANAGLGTSAQEGAELLTLVIPQICGWL